MRPLVFLVSAAILWLGACSSAIPAKNNLEGDWSGQILAGPNKINVITRFEEQTDGTYAGSLDTPEQVGSPTQALASIVKSKVALSFEVPGLQSSYSAFWSDDEEAWIGEWAQNGLKLPLELRKGLPADKPFIEGVDGTWDGSVMRGDREVKFVIRIETELQGTNGSFDSPSFGIRNVPIDGLSREGNKVFLRVPATGVEYEAELSADGNSMTGTWTLPGRPAAQVTFTRREETVTVDPPQRPQHPSAPFGYITEEVSFENTSFEGVTLAGTISLPERAGPFPAAVLVSGSGPQDRDGTVFGHKTLLVIADYLTTRGFAVLRFDDRGYGASTGNFTTATSADFATDVNAAIRYLSTRGDIDMNRVGVIGHSEGAVIGPIAASTNDEIDFLIMLAGPATKFVEVQLAQRRVLGVLQGFSEEAIASSEPTVREIYEAVRDASSKEDAEEKVRGLLTPQALAAFGVNADQKEFVVQNLTRDWLRYLLQYDAARVLGEVDIPVLALNGSLDWQVPAGPNLQALRTALESNSDATVLELEGLNHFFQNAQSGAVSEYQEIEETLSPIALDTIYDWLEERF